MWSDSSNTRFDFIQTVTLSIKHMAQYREPKRKREREREIEKERKKNSVVRKTNSSEWLLRCPEIIQH